MRVISIGQRPTINFVKQKQNFQLEKKDQYTTCLNFTTADSTNLQAIYLTPTIKNRKNNINSISFCGGMPNIEESRQGQDIRSLNGLWEFQPYNGPKVHIDEILDKKWPTMNLPSNLFLGGLDHFPTKLKIDEPPLPSTGKLTHRDPEEGFIYNGTVYYKRTVDIKDTDLAPEKHIFLEIDRSDYYTEVYVNNKKIPYGEDGFHEGYFQSWSVKIPKDVLHEGPNQILIKVSDPVEVVDMGQEFIYGWPKYQSKFKGLLGVHDGRPGDVSRRGQEWSTLGVNGGMNLIVNDGFNASKPMISPLNVTKDQATVNVKFKVENYTDEAKDFIVNSFIKPSNFENKEQELDFEPIQITVPPGGKTFEQSIIVKNPELWQSWDLGNPNLYNLELKMTDTSDPNRVFDSRSSEFGIRKIETRLLDPTDPKKWGVWLNGDSDFTYLRCSNYFATQWLSMADSDFYEKEAALIKEAGLNAVRVHACVLNDAFYRAMDEAGIMVIQDDPIQWGMNGSKGFIKRGVRQIREMVERLYNHACIILWDGHNEAPHALDWIEKTDPDQNLDLDKAMAGEIESMDPTRPVTLASGMEKSNELPDIHRYEAWYVRMSDEVARNGYDEYSVLTEYGAQGLSDESLLRQMLNPDTLDLKNSADLRLWEFGDFQQTPGAVEYLTGRHQNKHYRYFCTKDKMYINRGKNLKEFIENSQLYQAAVVKFFTEKQRQIKGKPSTAIYHFQLTDNWPAIATWSAVDGFRNKKKSFGSLKEAMQPILPSIKYNFVDPKAPIGLAIVNDLHKELLNHTIYWQIDNKKVQSIQIDKIGSNSTMEVKDLGKLTGVTKGNQKLRVWITNNEGKIIAENHLAKEHFVPRLIPISQRIKKGAVGIIKKLQQVA